MTVADTLTVRIEADAGELERALKRLSEDLKKAFAGIETAVAPLKVALDEIQKTMEKTADSADVFDKFIASFGNINFKTEESLKDLKKAFGDLFADAIVEGKKFSDVLAQLAKDLAALIVRRAIADPLADAAIGLFGSLFGGLFGGGRQHGGRVSPHKAFLVGEQGPELFVPPSFGEIVPNGQLGSGGNITINQTISIAPDVSAVARAEIVRQLPLIRNYTAQGITDARLRGALPA